MLLNFCLWLLNIPSLIVKDILIVLSRVRLFGTPWTVARSLSVEFSRQEYWSELPFPSAGTLPNPRIKPMSLASSALAGRFFTTVSPGKPKY